MQQAFVNGLHGHLQMVEVMRIVSDCIDQKNDELLALALAANAEMIVATYPLLMQIHP